MMKNILKSALIISAIVFLAAAMPIFTTIVHATEYVLLEAIGAPGETIGPGTNTTKAPDFSKYFEILYNFFIGATIVIAIIEMTIGGFQMTIPSEKSKSDGKERAENALKGLAIVLFAYIVLQAINPKTVNFYFNLPPLGELPKTMSSPPEVASWVAPWVISGAKQLAEDVGYSVRSVVNAPVAGGHLSESEARSKLADYTKNIKAPCPPNTTYQAVTGGCTSLNGIQSDVVNTLQVITTEIRISTNNQNYRITFNAGTELGHSDTGGHNTGSAVDLDKEATIDAFVAKNVKSTSKSASGKYTIYETKYGSFMDEGTHWHVITRPVDDIK